MCIEHNLSRVYSLSSIHKKLWSNVIQLITQNSFNYALYLVKDLKAKVLVHDAKARNTYVLTYTFLQWRRAYVILLLPFICIKQKQFYVCVKLLYHIFTMEGVVESFPTSVCAFCSGYVKWLVINWVFYGFAVFWWLLSNPKLHNSLAMRKRVFVEVLLIVTQNSMHSKKAMLSVGFYFSIQYCYRMGSCIHTIILNWLFAI